MRALRTRIKICGMTRQEDVDCAFDLGVDAIGFIFYHKSKRAVTLENAKKILINKPPFVDVVAVLVNPECSEVIRLVNELDIDLLQFHGAESPDFCQQFNKPYIKAIHPLSRDHILKAMNEFNSASALLLDTPHPNLHGGSGLVFDWRIVPQHTSKPFILAGGLQESNVQEAIERTNPYAVDVCSGVETAPGIKDPMMMKRFISAVHVVRQ